MEMYLTKYGKAQEQLGKFEIYNKTKKQIANYFINKG